MDPIKKWFMIGIVIISISIFSYILLFSETPIRTQSDFIASLCLFSWLIPLNILLLIIPFRMKLTTSSEGITYSLLGSHFIAWDDVELIRITPISITLLLGNDFESKPRIFGITNNLMGMKRNLPLMYFMWQWGNGGLREDFRRFAPHLFMSDESI